MGVLIVPHTMQVVLVLLVCVSTHVYSSTTCQCNGVTLPDGGGQCRTLYKGKPFCYVSKDSCTDTVQSTSPGLYWSYEPCETQVARMDIKCTLDRRNVVVLTSYQQDVVMLLDLTEI